MLRLQLETTSTCQRMSGQEAQQQHRRRKGAQEHEEDEEEEQEKGEADGEEEKRHLQLQERLLVSTIRLASLCLPRERSGLPCRIFLQLVQEVLEHSASAPLRLAALGGYK